MKHSEIEINQFIDGELSSNQQNEMFLHIAECGECRILLNDYMEIKSKTKNFYDKLESNFVTHNVFNASPEIKNYKYKFYFSFAAAILLAFLYLMQIKNTFDNDKKYSELNNKFISLKEDYNKIYPKYKKKLISDEKNKSNPKPEIISKKKPNDPKRKPVKKNIYAELRKSKNESSYLKYINSLPAKKITSDDFLTEQIAGN